MNNWEEGKAKLYKGNKVMIQRPGMEMDGGNFVCNYVGNKGVSLQ